MKRSQMLRKITRLLKTWEGSRLEGRTSKEILDLIEREGMRPPVIKRPEDFTGHISSMFKHEWESER